MIVAICACGVFVPDLTYRFGCAEHANLRRDCTSAYSGAMDGNSDGGVVSQLAGVEQELVKCVM
jgi:hypothetical protein